MQSGSARPGDLAGNGSERDDDAAVSLPTLIAELQQDRLWLLRQLDSGCWPEWRLDLAALERELGQLLDHLGERCAD